MTQLLHVLVGAEATTALLADGAALEADGLAEGPVLDCAAAGRPVHSPINVIASPRPVKIKGKKATQPTKTQGIGQRLGPTAC